MPPVIFEDKCHRCGACVEACQSDVFYGSKKGHIPLVTYPYECWHCNACVMECRFEAINLHLPLNMQPMYQEK